MIFKGGVDDIVRPLKLQKIINKQFAALPRSQKKKAILSAVIGNLDDAKTIGILNEKKANYFLRFVGGRWSFFR